MQFPLTISEIILACIITCIGSVIQGCIGIGLGFVAVPLLLLIDPVFIPGPLLLAALLLTLFMSYREFHAIDKRDLEWAVLGRIIGSVIGVFILNLIPRGNLAIFFAVMILLAVGISFSGLKLPINAKSLLSAGTLSGFMGTTSAIGGAPMALIYQYQNGPKIRGTLSSIFVVGTIISLLVLWTTGRFGFIELLLSLSIMPGIVLGFLLSGFLKGKIDDSYIRPAILIAAILSALFVLSQNI